MGGWFYPQGSGGGGVITGALVLAGVISPSALAAGTTNDYSPAGLSNVARLRVTTNAAGSSIGGLAPQVDGFTLLVFNLGPGDLILLDEGAGSTVNYRFAMPGDFLIPMDYGWLISYDLTSLRWRLI